MVGFTGVGTGTEGGMPTLRSACEEDGFVVGEAG